MLLLCFGLFLFVAAQVDQCGQFATCKECIANNPCGWCELNIRYEDGTMGPQCAGKPRDPNNPPPGYRPWTCPGPGFQNLYCPTYRCNNDTFRCEQLPRGSPGQQLTNCMAECSPPTYLCNRTTATCYQTVPGFGTDLTNCKKGCVAAKYTCNTKNYQCEVDPNGKLFDSCLAECYPPTYECDNTYKCVKTVPGRGSDFNSCNATCNPFHPPTPSPGPTPVEQAYLCDEDSFSCYPSKNTTGVPQSLCVETCGAPQNVTPAELIGDYRGIMVNIDYLKGEWQAQILESMFVIKDPSGAVFLKGTLGTYNSEIWLFTDKGTFRTIYTLQQLPEVVQLSWAFGAPNGKAPKDWETAMQDGPVFEFSKCLSTVGLCQWKLLDKKPTFKAAEKQEQAVSDPCSKYPNCRACISSLDYCGWCSVPVLYNGTIGGTNCGGLNKTKIPGLVCPGIFSTVNCPSAPVPVPAPKPVPPQPPVPSEPLFICSPEVGKCHPMNPKNESGGMPISFCELVCNVIPYVPPILVDRVWRGINVRLGYVAGEWTVVFGTTTATITDPAGKKITANVGTTSQFLYLDLSNGNRIYSLWQLETGPSVDFLSWAWGAEKGLPPKSYNEAMVGEGQNQFVFSGCPIDKKMPCKFFP